MTGRLIRWLRELGRFAPRPRVRRRRSIAVEALEDRMVLSGMDGPHLIEVEPNNSASTRTRVALNTGVQGVLEPSGDVDFYLIQVTEPGTLTATVTPRDTSGIDTQLTLFGVESPGILLGQRIGGGGLLAHSDDRAVNDANPQIQIFLLPGDYFVAVSGATPSEQGAYTFTTTLTPGADPFDMPDLDPALNRVVGTDPRALVVADFNRDNLQDIATANFGSGDVSVLLGAGEGYDPQRRFDVAGAPDSLRTMDYNADGRLDLLALDSTLGIVTVLPGIGDGTFSERNAIQLSAALPEMVELFRDGPIREVKADLNRGSAQDRVSLIEAPAGSGVMFADRLAVDFRISDALPIFLETPIGPILVSGLLQATGTELYAPTVSITPSTSRATQLVDDLNGDGALDALAVSRSGDILFRAGRVGQPGVFEPPVRINDGLPIARAVSIVETAQGKRIAAAELSNTVQNPFDTVGLYAYSASDGWTRVSELPAGLNPGRIAAKDLDGDGDEDLVVANNQFGFASLTFYRADAAGNFARAFDVKAGTAIGDLVLDDVNADGKIDVLIVNPDGGDLDLFLNTGETGTFVFSEDIRYRTGSGTYGVITSVVSRLANPLIFLVSGRANLLPPIYFSTSNERAETVVSDDFNGDGIKDLVVTNRASNNFALLLGKIDADGMPTGGFVDPILYTGFSRPTQAQTTDFNGDEKPDLAILNEGNQTVTILLGDGLGGFTEKLSPNRNGTFGSLLVGTGATGLSLVDVISPDGGGPDGEVDVLVGNEFGDLLILAGVGDGTFRPFVRSDQRIPFITTDLNGDGILDVILADQAQDIASAMLRSGTGNSFTPADFQRDGSNGLIGPGDIAEADLDGQFGTDLIFANSGSNNVLVYLREANGSFRDMPLSFFAGTNPVALHIANLNNDGLMDLAVANQGSNDVSVLLGGRDAGGNWTFTFGPRLQTGGAGPNAVTTRDFNDDGVQDLFVTNGLDGTLAQIRGIKDNTGAGTGFFEDTTLVPVTIAPGAVRQTFVTDSFVFALGQDGRLFRDGVQVFARSEGTEVNAFTVVGSSVVTANRGGTVSILSANGDGYSEQLFDTGATLGTPSALEVLQRADGLLDIYLTNVGELQPIVLTLDLRGELVQAGPSLALAFTLVTDLGNPSDSNLIRRLTDTEVFSTFQTDSNLVGILTDSTASDDDTIGTVGEEILAQIYGGEEEVEALAEEEPDVDAVISGNAEALERLREQAKDGTDSLEWLSWLSEGIEQGMTVAQPQTVSKNGSSGAVTAGAGVAAIAVESALTEMMDEESETSDAAMACCVEQHPGVPLEVWSDRMRVLGTLASSAVFATGVFAGYGWRTRVRSGCSGTVSDWREAMKKQQA